MAIDTIFIVNPLSAAGRTKARFDALKRQVQRLFIRSKIVYSEYKGHARLLSQQAKADGIVRIVAVGGDGTVNEVVNGMMAFNDPAVKGQSALGIVMSGTGENLRRSLNLAVEFEDMLLAIRDHDRTMVDLGVVDLKNSSGVNERKYFLNHASVGLTAQILQAVKKNGRAAKIWAYLPYVLASIGTLRKASPFRITTITEGLNETHKDASFIALCNGNTFAARLNFANSVMTDGLLDMVVGKGVRLTNIVKRLVGIYHKGGMNEPYLDISRHSQVIMNATSPVPIKLDGEVGGYLPATFAVKFRSFPVIL